MQAGTRGLRLSLLEASAWAWWPWAPPHSGSPQARVPSPVSSLIARVPPASTSGHMEANKVGSRCLLGLEGPKGQLSFWGRGQVTSPKVGRVRLATCRPCLPSRSANTHRDFVGSFKIILGLGGGRAD